LIPKVAGERNNFGPSFYAMDKFVRHSEYMGRKYSDTLDSIRSAIQITVEKPDARAFTEDIKTFLYLTKTDSDFELLKKAIEKYNKQDTSPIFNFRFAAPLMRLAHSLNKTDDMLALYLKDEANYLHTTVTPGFILMNKLFDERRFDDVLRVFNRLAKTLTTRVVQSGEREFFPFDALKLAIEANLEKNDDDTNKNAIQLFTTLKNIKPPNPAKMITCLFLTAIQRGNNELAHELYLYLESLQKNSIISANLRIISLCLNQKAGEALASFGADNQVETTDKRKRTFYFKSTLDTLKEAVNLSKNEEYRKMLDEVLSRIKSENLVAKSDIKEFATRQINFTAVEIERQKQEKRNNQNQNSERRSSPDSFKSRDRFTNRKNEQSFGENKTAVSNEQPSEEQPEIQTERQTNSPKSRRQYLE